MDAVMHRTVSTERIAFAAALMAAACAIGSLVLGTGLAFAWLTDHARISNELSMAPAAAPVQEAYAALYLDPDGADAFLMFDRGEEIPASREGWPLASSWRGMETGTDSFTEAGARPWNDHAGSVSRVMCGDAARAHPIRALDMQNWFSEMTMLTDADVSGITPCAAAEGSRPASKSMNSIFKGCAHLESISGLESWDVSGMTDFSYLFCQCSSLHSLDLSMWDVRCVMDASYLLHQNSSLVHLDVTGWDLEACTKAHGMFSECASLTEITGLETLRCPHAGYINGMFRECTSLERIDLSGFDMPGNGFLAEATMLASGCRSLRYLDLSGLAIDRTDRGGAWMYPEQSVLETLILSNKIKISEAPIPALPIADRPHVGSAGYWICDETGGAFGQHGLTEHLAKTFTHDGDHERIGFHASWGGWGESDPYAAAYQSDDGSMLLIMDRGGAAPDAFEGMHLILEARDFHIDGERGSALWRDLPLSEVRILSPLEPLSCRKWFSHMRSITSISGLDLLDMSRCTDVVDMFFWTNSARLDVEDWDLAADVEGVSNLLSLCFSLNKIDLSRWTADLNLNLAELHSLGDLCLPSNIRVSRFDQQRYETQARFDDGSWYADGTGEPLSPSEVRAMVNAAYGSGSGPLRFTHEKLDRSYAAVYRGPTGDALVFGRGLDIPDTSAHGSLIASFRGLEEQKVAWLSWNDFSESDRPWSGWAANITSIDSNDAARAVPLKPTAMSRWFQDMGLVQRIDALESGAIDASHVSDASWLFFGCSSLLHIPDAFMSSFTTELTEGMGMFGHCRSLPSLPAFNAGATGRLKESSRMFEECAALTSLDLGSWNIASLRYCSSMFRGCSALENLSLPEAFVAPQRENALQLAFLECRSLRELDGSTWDLSGTTTLFHAFNGCTALERIHGADRWDTGAVVTMNSAFRLCRALTLDCSGWDIGSVTDSDSFSLGAPGVTSPFETAPAMEEDPIDGLRAEGADLPDEDQVRDPDGNAPEHGADQDAEAVIEPSQDAPGADASEDPADEQPSSPEEGGPESGEAPLLTQESA